MMKKSIYSGIYEGAFVNKLHTEEHRGIVDGEIVTEVWYKLSLEEAKQFIENDEYTELKIEEGNELLGSWIKLVTTEHQNTITGKTRRYWSTSLRPYVQGYGCDGTTDMNIHTIANILAEKYGLDYRSLLVQSYPDQFSLSNDFSWLNDDVVMAETTIPEEIDPDLVLQDLGQINNHTLVINLGVELYKLGIISTNWEEFKNNQDTMIKEVQQAMLRTF